jgi:hypothetical protein
MNEIHDSISDLYYVNNGITCVLEVNFLLINCFLRVGDCLGAIRLIRAVLIILVTGYYLIYMAYSSPYELHY